MAGNDIRRVAGDTLRHTTAGLAAQVQQGTRNGKVLDYDSLGRARRLEKIEKGLLREPAHFGQGLPKVPEKSLSQRTQHASRPVRSLSGEEIRRHARLSGAGELIAQKSLAYVRARQLPQERPSASGRGALQDYLALQGSKSALGAPSNEEFIARMAPLPDFSGGAPELARRFYEASSDDDELKKLLAGFALEENDQQKVIADIRKCGHHHQTGYQPSDLTRVLARAMNIGDMRPSGADAIALLSSIDDRLAEMEGDPEVGRYINGALNIADEAEKTADPARFADDYADLVHGSEAWGEKCLKVLDRYTSQGRGDDLQELPRTLEAASRAADLDLHAEFPSTDKVRLQAAIESLSLVVRMKTVSESVDETVQFIERHHGKSIKPSELLRGVLEIFANPYGAASSLAALATRLGLKHPDESITLFREVGKCVRLMQQIFTDANASDAARTGVQDALDNAIAYEEMLLDQAEKGNPALAPKTTAPDLPLPMPAPHLMP
ncbi:TyeA family type III secretion system gatekeeper subunit [Lacisediminimonas sp.]|uniref:TyeA family type III secretion system gatekeeper subunit n=1 Tax=Lacisediminimonas sp. TaxID=3060582 RepID=UPI0027253794|nr:TyeA family type III secretion system gatekeeper subunit [Lacisediminimonas sp.]MDO8300136.1 TyeA family type III secretion system gatekeeper subunit [Lacisediminimonas sp.]